MIHILFILINLVLTALKLFKIGIVALFTSQFTFRILKRGNYYFPRFNTRKVGNYFRRIETRKVAEITFRVFDAASKIKILC